MDLADGVYIAANWRDISNYFEYSYSNNSGNGYCYILGEFPVFNNGTMYKWWIIFTSIVRNYEVPSYPDLNWQGESTWKYAIHRIYGNSDAEDYTDVLEPDYDPES